MTDAVGQACRIPLFLGVIVRLFVGNALHGLLHETQMVDVCVSSRALLGDEESHLFGIGGRDLLADEKVGEGLVVVEKTAVCSGEKNVVVHLLWDCWRVFDLGQDVLGQWLLLGVDEYAAVLEQVHHCTSTFYLASNYIIAHIHGQHIPSKCLACFNHIPLIHTKRKKPIIIDEL